MLNRISGSLSTYFPSDKFYFNSPKRGSLILLGLSLIAETVQPCGTQGEPGT